MKAKVLQFVWHDKMPVFSADFHPTSGRLATAGGDNYARIWKLSPSILDEESIVPPELLANLNRHTKAINVVRFSPDGELLATAGDDGSVILWKYNGPSSNSLAKRNGNLADENDFEDQEIWFIAGMLRSHVGDIYDLAWSPDSTMLLTGSIDNIIRIWDVKKLRLMREIREHSHYVQGVAWDPRGRFIASQSCDRSSCVFDLRLRKNGQISCVCIARNQKIDILEDNTIQVQETGEKEMTQENSLLSYPVDLPCELANTKMSTMQKLYHNENLPSFFRRLTFTPDGALLLTCAGLFHDQHSHNTNHAIYIYARSNFSRPIACIAGFKRPVIAIRCSPILFELRAILSRNKEGDLVKFEQTNLHKSEIAMDMLPSSFIRLPYRIIYAVATLDTVQLYDTQQTEPIAAISHLHYASLTDVAWTGDGLSLIITSSDGFCSYVSFDKYELGLPFNQSTSQALLKQVYTEPPLSESLRGRGQLKRKAAGTIEMTDPITANLFIEKSNEEDNESFPEKELDTSEKISCCTTLMEENTIAPIDMPMSATTLLQPARRRIAPMLVSPLT